MWCLSTALDEASIGGAGEYDPPALDLSDKAEAAGTLLLFVAEISNQSNPAAS